MTTVSQMATVKLTSPAATMAARTSPITMPTRMPKVTRDAKKRRATAIPPRLGQRCSVLLEALGGLERGEEARFQLSEPRAAFPRRAERADLDLIARDGVAAEKPVAAAVPGDCSVGIELHDHVNARRNLGCGHELGCHLLPLRSTPVVMPAVPTARTKPKSGISLSSLAIYSSRYGFGALSLATVAFMVSLIQSV